MSSLRDKITRWHLRLAVVVVLVVSAGVLVQGKQTAPRDGTAADVPEAPPRENVTVATESAKYGTIMAWHPNGSRLYYDDEHTKYFDVDPVEGESMTVEYAATDTIHTEGPTCSAPPCTRNVIERANLSTGETTEIYARYDYTESAAEWHDHERINDTHIIIADIIDDQVFIVNTETEIVTWLWDAQGDYAIESGGPFPEDWTHLNDVDLLDDGRVMVDLRNHDQVAFIDPGTGVQDDWTLGADGDHDVLYEQHNPDYIPPERGGPAVVVADSENGRLVEYQRENGTWNRSWTWTDSRMQWPRDADRLPNGNTLVSDTHGERLMEIAPNGSITWQVELAHPYDVERLGTGEDSAGGESAARLGLASRTDRSSTADTAGGDSGGIDIEPLKPISEFIQGLLPPRLVNGIFYVAPLWMGAREFLAAEIILFTALAWPLVELRWRFPRVSLRLPFYRKPAAEADEEAAEESE